MTAKLKPPTEQHPYKVWKGPVAWVAKDPETSVAGQGDSPEEALENLLEALELHLDEGQELSREDLTEVEVP